MKVSFQKYLIVFIVAILGYFLLIQCYSDVEKISQITTTSTLSVPTEIPTVLPSATTTVTPTLTITSTFTITPTVTQTPTPFFVWPTLQDSENNIIQDQPGYVNGLAFDLYYYRGSILMDFCDGKLPEPMQSFMDSIYKDKPCRWSNSFSYFPLREDFSIMINYNFTDEEEERFYNPENYFTPDEFCLFVEQSVWEGYGTTACYRSLSKALAFLEKLFGPSGVRETNGYCSNFDPNSPDYHAVLKAYEEYGVSRDELEKRAQYRLDLWDRLNQMYEDTYFTNVNVDYLNENHAIISFDYSISQELDLNSLAFKFYLRSMPYTCSNFDGAKFPDSDTIPDIQEYIGSRSGDEGIFIKFSTAETRGCEYKLYLQLVNLEDDVVIRGQGFDDLLILDPYKDNDS